MAMEHFGEIIGFVAKKPKRMICSRCNGFGFIETYSTVQSGPQKGDLIATTDVCPNCDGFGDLTCWPWTSLKQNLRRRFAV